MMGSCSSLAPVTPYLAPLPRLPPPHTTPTFPGAKVGSGTGEAPTLGLLCEPRPLLLPSDACCLGIKGGFGAGGP